MINIVLDKKHFIDVFEAVVFKDGDMVYALDTRTKAIIERNTDPSIVVKAAVEAVKTGGVVFIRDVDPATFTLEDIPDNVMIVIDYAGTITYLKKNVNVVLNNFAYRSFEVVGIGNTLRLRDNTDPNRVIELNATDPTTGDIHFFVNVSVDNMNPAGFLGINNLPPGFRWLNKNTSPVKVFDACLLNNGILMFRTGDATIDGQPTIDRFGIKSDGKLYRKNMPPPEYVSPIPTPPYRPDEHGAVILYIQVNLTPTATAEAKAVFSISPDNVTYFTAYVVGISANVPPQMHTAVLYVPSSWYVRWTLTNASIASIFKQYI